MPWGRKKRKGPAGGLVYSVLEQGFTAPIRDPLWGHIYLTPALEALTKAPQFMRLYRILQLGPTYCVYPGAAHTRGSHAIGVYCLARRLLKHLADRGADAWISPTGIRSFLAAALLHDLGHFPYAHSLKELPLESHEALTAKIIQSEPMKKQISATGADPYMTAAIIDENLSAQGSGETEFYRKLLSGVLDPDKLDYLNRDARYCGVPYGAQDVDFIFSRLHPHPKRGVDIDSKAVPSVESLLFSKYLMYRTVYWHPGVRSATGMIKKSLLNAIQNQCISLEELYNLDDPGLFALLTGRNAPLLGLTDKVREGNLYAKAAEFPYTPKLPPQLLDITARYQYEETIAAEASRILGVRVAPEEVIIDIPEPITFETGLYVADENRYFEQSSEVFTAEIVQTFTQTLRKIRVFVDPRYRSHQKVLRDIVHSTLG